MKKTAVLLIATAVFAFTSCTDSTPDDTVEAAEVQNEEVHTDLERDADFAVKAAAGSMMEVELGKLAVAKGVSTAVKKFGQSMIDDHSTANEELKALAATKNIALPVAMGDDKQEVVNKLNEKQGAEFDKEYIDYMVKDHKDDIDLFEDESEKGNDADVKNWAAGKVPILRHHLQMAEEIDNVLENKK